MGHILYRERMPDEYTKLNTIKLFNQKDNKNIPIIEINYSQISYRLFMSKNEVENILIHLYKNIGESIFQENIKIK